MTAASTRLAHLLLSGGGLKGAYEAAVERVLREEGGYRWQAVAGVSVGALSAALICREAYDELRGIWQSVKASDFYDRVSWPHVLWRIARGKRGAYDNSALRGLIERHTTGKPIRIPCSVGYTVLPSGDWVLAPPTTEAVWASATMPVVFEPLPGGLVDGGVRAITPLAAAVDSAVEIVAVLCNPRGQQPAPEPRNIIEVAQRSLDIALQDNGDGDLEETLRINELVKQATAQGARLTKADGSFYRHVPITVVAPSESLGDTLDDDPAVLRRRWERGEADARAVLARKAAA